MWLPYEYGTVPYHTTYISNMLVRGTDSLYSLWQKYFILMNIDPKTAWHRAARRFLPPTLLLLLLLPRSSYSYPPRNNPLLSQRDNHIFRAIIHLPFHFCAAKDERQISPITSNSKFNNDDIATMSGAAASQSYASLAKSLMDDVVNATEEPTPERVLDILSALARDTHPEQITIEILESTQIGKILVKAVKACKRHKRTSSSPPEQQQWSDVISTAEDLISKYKEAADKESKSKSKQQAAANVMASQQHGLPTSTSAYKTRLLAQRKELYKDPPTLPPPHIIIESQSVKQQPKRNKTTGELTFEPGNNKDIVKVLKEFHPNRTPEEVLRSGSFGGTYFRPITSAVTNIHYNSSAVLKDTLPSSWIDGLNKSTMLTSSTYNISVNKYKVKCGGSLGMWESSGWISDADPYGWFQWYCRFYLGRRCSDDARQISRWCKSAGVNGRFRSQLCNKILSAGAKCDDVKISPVIRQTLLHWGLEITEDVLSKHRKK